ncbi:enoyl-CoA hydratase/isomerase family protein [Salarchaeum japonicum]|uniref:Enoyl-CoA hydratase-related protein n=1 Tax=Salarchaeum japonicum TaxID=555573 RepID=A0AAV3T1M7_9EURY|nr:enoyl-CoA hydratase/isomerase family protein [Salarchaeum japonicum]
MPSIESEHVRIEVEDSRADVVITRPEKRNALTGAAVRDLTDAVHAVDADDAVRAATLRGEGGVFCAGFDLEMMAENDVREHDALHRDFRALLDAIDGMTTPTVAAVQGAGIAGGFELTLPCDFRVLGADAKYGVIEVDLGIFPHQGSTQRLPRLVGLAKAKELVLTGEFVDPAEADRINLVTEVAPDDEVDDRARELADSLTENAPRGVENALRAFSHTFDVPLDEGLDYEHALAMEVYGTDDRREGFEAQLEGRDPEFSGR